GYASHVRRPAHGDLAPWNLLHGAAGWMLVDWAAYRDDGLPFFDVFHCLVQTHAVLGRPTISELTKGLGGKGWVAGAVEAYAEGADLPASEALPYFRAYLRAGQEDARLISLVGAPGVSIRKRLLETFGER